MKHEYAQLFSEYKLGNLTLKNRIVMAPMTRSRATGNVPNELMVKYYSDRAGAGLIITEGTAPGPNGLGYARIPGMYSSDQLKGWKEVTEAVHEHGGKIFIQLMHTGRIGHPGNIPEGGKVVAPSAIAGPGPMWTDAHGMQEMPVPEAIAEHDIPAVIGEYVHSAKAAIEAGFDGVELHCANGYLPMQFLSEAANQRDDNYGGSYERRNRFVLELAVAVAGAIGKEKTGIRLSPFNNFNGMTADVNEEAQYTALTEGLKKTGLAYMHLLCFAIPPAFTDKLHMAFGGTFILNGGYTPARAEADLEAGRCELVSFGSPFIANPDFPSRIENGYELAVADQATFYTPGEKGYSDYPAAAKQ